MNRTIAVIFAFAFLLALGCAAQGNKFEKIDVPDKQAVIYVYRPYEYGGSLLKPSVTCGDETARIGPGGYHAFVVPAGPTTCEVASSESHDQVEIDADPRVHYVKEEFGWGMLTGHPHLLPVDTDTAHTEIEQCCVQETPTPKSTP
jgi:hypothetical protein